MKDLLATEKYVIGLVSPDGKRMTLNFSLTGHHNLVKQSFAKGSARVSRSPVGPSVVAWDSYSGHIPFVRSLDGGVIVEGSLSLGYSMAQVVPDLVRASATSPIVRLSISDLYLSPTLVSKSTSPQDKSPAIVPLTSKSLPPLEIPKSIYDQADWKHTVYAQPDAVEGAIAFQVKEPIDIKKLFPPPAARRGVGGHGFNANLHDVATIAQATAVIVSVLAFNKGKETFDDLPPQDNVPFRITFALFGHAEAQ